MAESEAISEFWLGDKLRAQTDYIQKVASDLINVNCEIRVERLEEGWARFSALIMARDEMITLLSVLATEGTGPSQWRRRIE